MAPRLAPYLLALRDPADHTNDLGRKAIAIKHLQATFRTCSDLLEEDIARNKQDHTLINQLIGSSYLVYVQQRSRLQRYGRFQEELLLKEATKTAKELASNSFRREDPEVEAQVEEQPIADEEKDPETIKAEQEAARAGLEVEDEVPAWMQQSQAKFEERNKQLLAVAAQLSTKEPQRVQGSDFESRLDAILESEKARSQ